MEKTLSVEPWERGWRCHCSCGWNSKDLPFPNADAAYHCGHLHWAVAHPEQIDWDEEREKILLRLRIEGKM